MEHLTALISFVVVFVVGFVFYMALPIIDPTLVVEGVSVNKSLRSGK